MEDISELLQFSSVEQMQNELFQEQKHGMG